jgi:hypothetical protein
MVSATRRGERLSINIWSLILASETEYKFAILACPKQQLKTVDVAAAGPRLSRESAIPARPGQGTYYAYTAPRSHGRPTTTACGSSTEL